MMEGVGDQGVISHAYGGCRRSEVAEGDGDCWRRLPKAVQSIRWLIHEVEESCDESREGSHTRSCGDEMRDHVMELRVRDNGMAV
jgi:hypothetical protein